jgi:hypothetical protein
LDFNFKFISSVKMAEILIILVLSFGKTVHVGDVDGTWRKPGDGRRPGTWQRADGLLQGRIVNGSCGGRQS